MNLDENYLLNPEYALRSDKNRAVLLSRSDANHSYTIFLHPVLALMLSYFDGSLNLKDTLQLLNQETGVAEKDLLSQVKPLIENTKNSV